MRPIPGLPEFPQGQPDLESDRLLLRKLRLDDAEDMFEWASDDVVTQFLSWPTHKTADDSRRYIQTVLDGYRCNEFAGWGIVLKPSNKVVGSLTMRHWQKEHLQTEIGYVMNPRFQGRGIMTEAMRMFLAFGFETLLLNRIEARCFTGNLSSERVMQKVGMVLEGTLRQHQFIKGAFHDFRVYALLREEYFEARSGG